MKYYSAMSDYEISCEVGRVVSFADYLLARNEQKNYCNSWADAGPIIAESKICLAYDVFAEVRDGGGWVASPAFYEEGEQARSDNPLRAAMIVFLMMKDAEKGHG